MASTHSLGHTLDLIISRSDSDFVRDVDVVPMDPEISDHALVTCCVDFLRPPLHTKIITFCNYRNIDQIQVSHEIECCLNTVDTTAVSADHLIRTYNNSLKSIFDKHCPEVVKEIQCGMILLSMIPL